MITLSTNGHIITDCKEIISMVFSRMHCTLSSNYNLDKCRYLNFDEASLRKNIFVSRRISCTLRPTLQSKKNNKKYTMYLPRAIRVRACVLFRVTNVPRLDCVVRVARIVAPAGVGGAQFIRNNYYGDNRNAYERIWDAGVSGFSISRRGCFDFN